MNIAVKIEPFIAMVDASDGSFADRGPEPTADRLKSEPMLVKRPDFNRGLRRLLLQFFNSLGQLLLKFLLLLLISLLV